MKKVNYHTLTIDQRINVKGIVANSPNCRRQFNVCDSDELLNVLHAVWIIDQSFISAINEMIRTLTPQQR